MNGRPSTRRATWILTGVLLLCLAAAVPAAEITANKGIFAKGKLYGGVTGGYISTSGDNYLMLGLGLGYSLADGLGVGLDYETWLVGSPTVNKLAPWVGYTFWKVEKVKPYVAAFYRQSWVSGYDDYQDIGARLGVFMPRGRSYLGLGVVYEYRLDAPSYLDDDNWYPEVRFAVGF